LAVKEKKEARPNAREKKGKVRLAYRGKIKVPGTRKKKDQTEVIKLSSRRPFFTGRKKTFAARERGGKRR